MEVWPFGSFAEFPVVCLFCFLGGSDFLYLMLHVSELNILKQSRKVRVEDFEGI